MKFFALSFLFSLLYLLHLYHILPILFSRFFSFLHHEQMICILLQNSKSSHELDVLARNHGQLLCNSSPFKR
ncbi:hypothetical protein F5890DRAFT_264805 [Lentinula detonsa]|uniref:Uncharacterized protein n=1 Tax=Lentinula detonsa TaxID=2804962 RepID=A0AA38Q842_9AGAR|nr:hypothetical protein F5890DRAFT_264805 [Lentinula detonsa]